MKKTLFLTHILTAFIACSGFLHAQEENGPREMKGNQTYNMIADEKFALYVTGQNNWIRMDNQHRTHVTFTYQNPTSIVNGELSLEKVKIGPDMGDEKWEMGANSRLNLGGTDAALVWFKVTGPSAEINNGVLNLWEGQSYTLGGNLGGTAGIVLKDNSRLDLGGKTLTNPMTIDSSATIGNGSYNGALVVKGDKTLTLCGNLGGTGNITLNDNARLDLGTHSLDKALTLDGSAIIGNGAYNGTLAVQGGKTLILSADLGGTGNITLGDNAKLNLNGYSISKAIDWNVNSGIEGKGVIRGNLLLRDNTSYTWNYTAVQIVGNVVLGAGSMFELKGQSIGSATLTASNSVISNATVVGTFSLGDGVSYTWSSDALYICGDVSLGDKAALNLGGHILDNTVSMKGTATIGSGTLNGTLSMGGGKTLNLGGNLSGSGTIAMAANDVLNLGGFELGTAVAVNGSATIGNGWFHDALSVAANQTLSLNADVKGTGSVTLGNDAKLDLGGKTLGCAVSLEGSATVGGGRLNGSLTVEGGETLTLSSSLSGEGAITLENEAELDLDRFVLEKAVVLEGSATIGDGSYHGTLTVHGGATLTLSDNLGGNGGVTMEEGSRLQLNDDGSGNTLSKEVSATGNVHIGGGSIDGTVYVDAGKTLTLCGELGGKDDVVLGEASVLNLAGHKLNKAVTLAGTTATVSGGEMNAALNVGANKTFSLGGDLRGGDVIALGESSVLNLNGHTLGKGIRLDGSASMSGGIHNGDVEVRFDKTLTLGGDLSGTGTVILQGGTALNLADNILNKNVTLDGSATIGGGTINGAVNVRSTRTLTLGGDLDGANVLTLQEYSKMLLGGHVLTKSVCSVGNVTMSNGTLDAAVEILGTDVDRRECRLLLDGVAIGSHATFTMWNNAILDLGGKEVRLDRFTLKGTSSVVGGGGKLLVESGDVVRLGSTLYAQSVDLEVRGGTLDFAGKALAAKSARMTGDATMGNGALDNGLYVEGGKKLTLCGNFNGTAEITLGNAATLDMGGYRVNKAVVLQGAATLSNGTIGGTLRLNDRVAFTWSGDDLELAGGAALGAGSRLDLGSHSINNVTVSGIGATISNGTVRGTLSLQEDAAFAWNDDKLKLEGGITMGLDSILYLGGHTIGDVTLTDDADIFNGTISGSLTLKEDASFTWFDEDLEILGRVDVGKDAEFDLCGRTIDADVAVGIRSEISGGGTIAGNLILSGSTTFTWADKGLHLGGNVILMRWAQFDMGGQTLKGDIVITAADEPGKIYGAGTIGGNLVLGDGIFFSWSNKDLNIGGVVAGSGSDIDLNGRTIGNATLTANNSLVRNGTVIGCFSLGDGVSYTWGSLNGLNITGTVALHSGAALNLNGQTLQNTVRLEGSAASLANGTLNGNLILAEGVSFTWSANDLKIKGGVVLKDRAELNLAGHALDKPAILEGSAIIGGGAINTNLSVGSGKTLTLNANLQGTADIAIDDGALELGNYTWSKSGSSMEGTRELYTMQGIAEPGTGDVKGSIGGHAKADSSGLAGAGQANRVQVQGVLLSTHANFTLSHADVGASVIDIGKGTTMYLVDVNIRPDTRITDDAAVLNMKDTRAWLEQDVNTSAIGTETLGADTPLLMCGNNSKAITLSAGSTGVNLSCDMFNYVTLDGTNLWLDMTDIAQKGTFKDSIYFTLKFDSKDPSQEGAKAMVNTGNLSVTVKLDGASYTTEAYYNPNELVGGLAPRLYFVLPAGPEPAPVPEPTTGALSLLGLGLLASRRRRR